MSVKNKTKIIFYCRECGGESPKWSGQCGHCQAWNSLDEAPRITKKIGYAGVAETAVEMLADIACTEATKFTTHSAELDRVLGGGLVTGSVILLGGDPGIGKSTLLLQTLTQAESALYITGEESLQQVSLRAERLKLPKDKLACLAQTHVETILQVAAKQKPKIMVIDSIQTVFTDKISAAPGGVSQVRESAALLVQYAKQNNCALFLVGHVTKEGALAGPRVLEHMVDTVLYFEGQSDNRFRAIRAVKNRFGAVNELGIFAMTEKGLKEVTNPSALFLSSYEQATPGSTVMVSWEGTRPLLVEVQALVDEAHTPQPRRVTVGLEQNRLAMLLAVFHRHTGTVTYDQDVFINAVGGVRVTETAADLAILCAIYSSLRNKPLKEKFVIFGEVGLAGEIRPVQSGQERLKEAAKHGFTHAIIPAANAPKQTIDNLIIYPVKKISDVLQYL